MTTDDIQLLYIQAYRYWEDGKITLAEEKFIHILTLSPNHIDTHICLGFVYHQKARFDLSEKHFRAALTSDPDNENAHRGLGYIFIEKHHYDEALEHLRKALALNPKSADTLQCLALYHQRQNAFSAAEAAYKQCFTINPQKKGIYRELGFLAMRSERIKDACAYFEKALQENCNDIETLRYLSNLYIKRRKYDKALQFLIDYTDKSEEGDDEDNRRFLDTLDLLAERSKTKSKIKLIRTPGFISLEEGDSQLGYSLLLPLGLGQIASYLRSSGFAVDLDDLYIKLNYFARWGMAEEQIDPAPFYDEKRIDEYCNGGDDSFIDEMLKRADRYSPLEGYPIILISVAETYINVSSISFALAYAHYIKKYYRATVIVGGCPISLDSIVRKRADNIDFIVKNDGGKNLFGILTALTCAKATDCLPSLDCHDNIIDGDFAHFPSPADYSGLPLEMYRYRNDRPSAGTDDQIHDIIRSFNASAILISPLRIFSGCPYECIFCCSSGPEMRYALSPKGVVARMAHLQDQYQVDHFFFLSDTINISTRYIHELCDEILKTGRKVQWSDCARADNLDLELLKKMRASGCIRLIYGIETASPRLLGYIDKRISIKRLEKILRWTDEAGIWTGLEIICGLPHEQEEDLRTTIRFIEDHLTYINTIYYNQFNIRCPSKMFLHPERYGVENINEINWYRQRNQDLQNFVKYSFDEIDGLKWNEKWSNIVDNYTRMAQRIGKGQLFPLFEMEHFLFFLYSRYKGKEDIVSIYEKVVDSRIALPRPFK